MPYIIPPTYCADPLEHFNRIVQNYKHIIENNATARCMIGFTAASLIRNERDMDMESFEHWLCSIEPNRMNTTVALRQVFALEETSIDEREPKVSRILSVVRSASPNYSLVYHEEKSQSEDDQATHDGDSEEDGDTDFTLDNQEAYELNRFISRDPYSSTTSRPTHKPIPKYTTVNYQSSEEQLLLFPAFAEEFSTSDFSSCQVESQNTLF